MIILKGEEMMKKDDFDGQKKEQHFQIPLRFLRDGKFLKWVTSTEGKVWLYLCSYILRGPIGNEFCDYLHRRYFLGKNKLVARWSLKNIANILELKSAGGISSIISSLERKRFIVKHPEILYGKRVSAYEFGIHSGEPHFYEYLHVFTYFTKLKGELILERFV